MFCGIQADAACRLHARTHRYQLANKISSASLLLRKFNYLEQTCPYPVDCFMHRLVVVRLHRPKTDRPRQLASINTHCLVRGVAQLTDRIYVVCAGYGTVEVFSSSDCRWLDRIVVSGLDDPHDLQVRSFVTWAPGDRAKLYTDSDLGYNIEGHKTNQMNWYAVLICKDATEMGSNCNFQVSQGSLATHFKVKWKIFITCVYKNFLVSLTVREF